MSEIKTDRTKHAKFKSEAVCITVHENGEPRRYEDMKLPLQSRNEKSVLSQAPINISEEISDIR